MIHLLRKTDNGWEPVGEYPDWGTLYAANPEALDGLRYQKRFRVEMPSKVQAESAKAVTPIVEAPKGNGPRVFIRRHWNDWRVASVFLDDIQGEHWDSVSGGVGETSPEPLIYGYVYCDRIDGEIAHSCAHGKGPHRIKVCVLEEDNSTYVNHALINVAGPRHTGV